MLTWIRTLFSPPVFEGDEIKTRNALLITILVRVGIGLAVLRQLLLLLSPVNPWIPWIDVGVLGFLLGISAVILIVLHQGRVRLASILLLSVFFVIFTSAIYGFGGLNNPITGGFLVVIFLASLLLGRGGTLTFGVLSALVVTGIHVLDQSGVLPEIFIEAAALPVFLGILFIMALSGGFIQRVINTTTERLQDAEQVLLERNRTLEASRDAFQQQAEDLERRARSLETVAGLARDAISALNMDSLLTRVVTLVSQRLGFYHTGLFLLDETGEKMVLRAASSAEGRRLVASEHSLPVALDTLIETVAVHGQSRVRNEIPEMGTEEEPIALPETRSQILLPLKARGEILGVLDVQGQAPQAFDAEVIRVLEILSDQIAVAINNARLFEQVQQSLEAERHAYRELSRKTWSELARARLEQGFVYEQGDVRALAEGPDAEVVSGEDAALPALALPIRLRGQSIGRLVAHKSEEDPTWTADEQALMTTLVEQLATALESARLYEDTQRRAAQEQVLSEITRSMRETLDVETILQTAVQEMRQALNLEEVEVRMGIEE